MHEAGHSLEEIADVGVWALRAKLDAVHTYFKTKLQQQLAIKRGWVLTLRYQRVAVLLQQQLTIKRGLLGRLRARAV